MGKPIQKSRIFAKASSGGSSGTVVKTIVAGTNITVDNTDPTHPIVATTATKITVVANFSALPSPTTVTGSFYWCEASQGTKWLPGGLGGTYYSAGLYYSNGTSWEFIDVPYQATQATVNTGTNNDQFVTPSTLTNATSIVNGSGSSGQITYWTGSKSIVGNSLFNVSTGTNNLFLAFGGTSGQNLPAGGETFLFEIINDGSLGNTNEGCMRISTYGTTGGSGDLNFHKFGGTPASPTALGTNNTIMSLGSRGYDGSISTQSAAAIETITTQAWTSIAHGIKFQVGTTANGSISRVINFTVDQDGSNIFGNSGAKYDNTNSVFYLGAVFSRTANNEIANVTRNSNAATILAVQNTTNGTAAGAHIFVESNGVDATLSMLSPLYTTNGAFVGSTAILESDGSNGLNLVCTNANGKIGIYTGGFATGNLRTTILKTGEFLIGATATVESEMLNVTKNQNNITEFLLQNNTAGTASQAKYKLLSDGAALIAEISSSTFTSSGFEIANSGALYTNGSTTAGMSICCISSNSSASMRFYTSNTLRASFLSTGSLLFAAGTTAAGTAPIKLTSGTNMTSVENGAIEYDGTNYFVSSGGVRYTLAKLLTGSATLDFPSTAAQSSSDLTITVTGATLNDPVTLGIPNGSVNAASDYMAWVSSANTVSVRFSNYSLLSINPASGTFKVSVQQF